MTVVVGCFDEAFVLFRGEVVEVVVDGVHGMSVAADFVVDVGTGGLSGVTQIADDVASFDLLSGTDVVLVEVGVEGVVVESVVDFHAFAVAAPVFGGVYLAVSGGVDGSADRSGEVHAGMELDGLVDGVDAVAVGGGETYGFVVQGDGGDGGNGGEHVHFITDEVFHFIVGTALDVHGFGEGIEFFGGVDDEFRVVHVAEGFVFVVAAGAAVPDGDVDGVGFEDDAVDVVVAFLQPGQNAVEAVDFSVQQVVLGEDFVLFPPEGFFFGGFDDGGDGEIEHQREGEALEKFNAQGYEPFAYGCMYFVV